MTTKAEILQRLTDGTGHTEPVDASELGDGVKLEVRALSKTEVNKVNARIMRGQTVQGTGRPGDAQPENMEMALDLEKIVEGQGAAEALTVAYGLSVGETWEADEVAAFPSKLFDRLLAKIRELTDDPELLESAATFRTDG